MIKKLFLSILFVFGLISTANALHLQMYQIFCKAGPQQHKLIAVEVYEGDKFIFSWEKDYTKTDEENKEELIRKGEEVVGKEVFATHPTMVHRKLKGKCPISM